MLRIVRTGQGAFEIDEKYTKAGRGAYFCPSSKCVTLLKQNRGLDQSFREQVSESVYEEIIRRITGDTHADVNKLLGFAYRARKVKVGKVATFSAIDAGKAFLIVIADDVSEKIKKELAKPAADLIKFADKNTIGKLFGRTEVGIFAITDEGFAKAILKKFHGK